MKQKMLMFLAMVLMATVCTAGAKEVKPADVAGRQIELCMIGDSITWWNMGDCFRKEALKVLPNLAFIGTHTGRFGYSHAGEGGDNVRWGLKKRINDKNRVPDARYYHLLMGVNDSAGTRKDEDIAKNARLIADALKERVSVLLTRPTTEKVFLGTIFPCVHDHHPKVDDAMKERYRLRDLTASKVNEYLRAEVPAEFKDKVVLVEYEKVLRARDDWKKIIRLHPRPEGYAVVGPILAEYVGKYAVPENKPLKKFGVEVTNLWDQEKNAMKPILQGWFLMSFDVKEVVDGHVSLKLQMVNEPHKGYKPYEKTVRIPAKPGDRVQFEFEGRNAYVIQLEVQDLQGKIDRILVEKMRPSKKASVYGVGTYVDSTSLMSLGEKFVPVR